MEDASLAETLLASKLEDMSRSYRYSVCCISLPFVILLAIIPASLNYRWIKQNKHYSRHRRQKLITLNAFGTELIQILVAVASVFAFARLHEILTNLAKQLIRNLDTPVTPVRLNRSAITVLPLFACTCVAFVHTYAVSLVDVIESRIVLGKWNHPYGGTCFVVTRFLFARLWWTITNWWSANDRATAAGARENDIAVVSMNKRKDSLAQVAERRKKASFMKPIGEYHGDSGHRDLLFANKMRQKRLWKRTHRREQKGKPSVRGRRSLATSTARPTLEGNLPTPSDSGESHLVPRKAQTQSSDCPRQDTFDSIDHTIPTVITEIPEESGNGSKEDHVSSRELVKDVARVIE